MTMETKGESNEDDKGPSPKNNRDNDKNQRDVRVARPAYCSWSRGVV